MGLVLGPEKEDAQLRRVIDLAEFRGDFEFVDDYVFVLVNNCWAIRSSIRSRCPACATVYDISFV